VKSLLTKSEFYTTIVKEENRRLNLGNYRHQLLNIHAEKF